MQEKKQKQLFIFAGPNGCGKTTLSTRFLEGKNIKFLNADNMAKEINPGDVDSVQLQAGKKFFKELSIAISKNHTFALETTLSGSYLIDVIKKVKAQKYRVHIIYFFLENPESAIDRIKIRVRKGGHHIPSDVVIRRFYRSKEKFWNIYRVLVDSWELFFNGDNDLSIVATGTKSEVRIMDDHKMELFLEDIKNEKRIL